MVNKLELSEDTIAGLISFARKNNLDLHTLKTGYCVKLQKERNFESLLSFVNVNDMEGFKFTKDFMVYAISNYHGFPRIQNVIENGLIAFIKYISNLNSLSEPEMFKLLEHEKFDLFAIEIADAAILRIDLHNKFYFALACRLYEYEEKNDVSVKYLTDSIAKKISSNS